MLIEGVLLDGSGTIVDDLSTCYNATRLSLTDLGYRSVTLEEYLENVNPIQKLYGLVGLYSKNHMSRQPELYGNHFLEMRESVRTFDDVMPGVKKLSDSGIVIGVVTQQLKALILHELQKSGLSHYIPEEYVVAFEDSVEHKPSPMPVSLGLGRIDVSASAAVLCGDTIQDIQAGQRAGTRTVAISRPNGSYHSKEKLSSAGPHKVVSDFSEFVAFIEELNKSR